jgi:Protein of unknown function (DUF3592)
MQSDFLPIHVKVSKVVRFSLHVVIMVIASLAKVVLGVALVGAIMLAIYHVNRLTNGDLVSMIFYGFSLVCLIGSIGLGYTSILDYRRAKQSKDWPTTRGRVYSSEILCGYEGMGVKSYAYQVQYDYSVNGQNYRAKRVTFNDRIPLVFMSSEALAYQTASLYPLDCEVIVYYHPDKPQVATLQTEPVPIVKMLFTFALCLAIIFMGFLSYSVGLAAH